MIKAKVLSYKAEMRIISGKYKGRNLVHFNADHIRPTTDRVKESIFNILQSEFEDAIVLDLFCGTGNLAIEALSRGAKSVDSVELSTKSIEIMQKNKDLLKIGDEWQWKKADAIKFMNQANSKTYDIIMIDPPFTEKMAHSCLETLSQSKLWQPNTIIFIEASKQERLELQYANLKQYDLRNFGDKRVGFYKYHET